MNDRFNYSIGVGMFIRRATKIIVGPRGPKCSRGVGCLALPGGHVEAGETIVQAAIREVREETGLLVTPAGDYPAPSGPGARNAHLYSWPFAVPGLLAVTDHMDIHQQQDGNLLPHLSLWILMDYAGGEPTNVEDGKCDGWAWMTPQEVAVRVGESGDNPTHPQYYWTPMPLWRRMLRPYFGTF